MCNGTLFTIERIFSSDGVNPSAIVLLGQCLTTEILGLLAVTGNYGIMKKKVQMRREISRGSDTYITVGVSGINIRPVF